MQKLAYLGLGIMGTGMAGNLLEAGHPLAVWNRTRSKADPFAEKGATVATTPSETASQAEVVFYCLTDDDAVEEVVFGDDGLLAGAREGQLFVDMSTVSPNTSVKEAFAFQEIGARFLDAPVFGTRPHAAEGKLWIVVGGEREDYEKVRPLLEVMAQSTHYMGANGKGAGMKLVGNMVVSIQLEALGEAMVLAERIGLNQEEVLDVLGETDFRSPLFTGVGRSVLKRDFSVSFTLKNMLKDANLIADLAGDLGAPTPVAAVVREGLKTAVNQGWGDENVSAAIKRLEVEAAVRLGNGNQ